MWTGFFRTKAEEEESLCTSYSRCAECWSHGSFTNWLQCLSGSVGFPSINVDAFRWELDAASRGPMDAVARRRVGDARTSVHAASTNG
jgi:hypothetical protein